MKVDLIKSQIDLAEMVKLMSFAGMDLSLEHVDDDPPGMGAHVLLMAQREEFGWLSEEIANLIALQALATGTSVNGVLEAARADLVRRHVPIDRPIQDKMEIGDGRDDHPGHEDT